jgi:hypothetical protein
MAGKWAVFRRSAGENRDVPAACPTAQAWAVSDGHSRRDYATKHQGIALQVPLERADAASPPILNPGDAGLWHA